MFALRLRVCDEQGGRFGDKMIVVVNWFGPEEIVVGVVVLDKGLAGEDFAVRVCCGVGVSHGCDPVVEQE